MTTIAFDGRFFAADSATRCGGIPLTVCKIVLIPGYILAGAGMLDELQPAIEWLKSDRSAPRPKMGVDNVILQVNLKTKIVHYLGGELWENNQDLKFGDYPRLHAIGSGSQGAMAAMLCGKNAIEAVFIACQVDEYSRPPVHCVDLNNGVIFISLTVRQISPNLVT